MALLQLFFASSAAFVPHVPSFAPRVNDFHCHPQQRHPLTMMADDPWTIIGAPRTATRQEIRKAYRSKARKLHPDVSGDPNTAEEFVRLVEAFETLMDETKRGSAERRARTSSARERANAKWDEMNRRAGYSSSSSARDRPAGSRRQAEKATREQSERRRMRWREIAFEDMWRNHMPLGYEERRIESQRAAFIASLEVAVQAFARGERQSGAQTGQQQQGQRLDPEAAETAELVEIDNREVLRSELADARHRRLKHNERVRYLEAELKLAEEKAAMWRGATPGSESERTQCLERELAYLQLGKRLRERVGEQRLALERIKAREKAITERLATMPAR